DNTGTDKYNDWLSYKRASAVAGRMVNKYGVNPEQIQMRGMGETQPIGDNDTEEGRQMNRRVILIIPSDTPAATDGEASTDSAMIKLNLTLPEQNGSSGDIQEIQIAAQR
ncbi:MAG TPA: OmpA family protein, partial [Pseudomonadales bacterium]|nr:OmpA family protein [Pseudomonadales bacterium]